MIKRLLALSATMLALGASEANAQSPLNWQGDTVYQSVVGRVVSCGPGFKNASTTRELRITDMYFVHQADSIFICDERFNSSPLTLPAISVTGAACRFKAPIFATTVYDTLVTRCAFTDDPNTVFTLRRSYVGTTTTDSSTDSARACVYGHDCNTMFPVDPGDSSHGLLCYDVEYLPGDTIFVTSIEFVGPDAASFHLEDSTFPKSCYALRIPTARISAPYTFSPVRLTGPKRYQATAIAKMYASDGILCHESDIAVTGNRATPGQDTAVVNLFPTDTLPIHFSKDSTTRWHHVMFFNNSPSTIKIDSAYMGSGGCFAIDQSYPPYGTKIYHGEVFSADFYFRGDSTSAGWNCSDTLFMVVENALQVISFPLHNIFRPEATVGVAPAPLPLALIPNPSNGSVDIQSGSSRIDARIEIYDILGNLIASRTGTSWRWTGADSHGCPVPDGTYIVRMSEGLWGRTSSQRLVMSR